MKIIDPLSFSVEKDARFLLLLFVSFSIVFILAWSNFHISGDTIVLINSIKTIVSCIENKDWAYCKSVAHFPISQHLIGLVFYKLGIGVEQLLTAFKLFNIFAWFAGFFLPLLFWKNSKFQLSLTVFFIIYIASPLWWYGSTSFNEIVTAMMISLFFMSLMYGTYLPLLTSFLVVLTKEIAFVYVIFWTLILIYLKFRKRESNIKVVLISSLVGTAIGLICQILFNFWRFKSIINTELLSVIYRTPTLDLKVNFFIAQWLAPNVGIIFFWPGFILLLFIYFKNINGVSGWTTRGAVALFFISITLGFASWCAPFGWIAYGHRLIVPWIPGLVLFMLYTFSAHLKFLLKQAYSKRWLWISVKSLIFCATVPSVAILFNIGSISNFFVPDETCPHTAVLQESSEYYYNCIVHYAWNAKWIHSVTLTHVDWFRGGLAIVIALFALMLVFQKTEKIIRED